MAWSDTDIAVIRAQGGGTWDNFKELRAFYSGMLGMVGAAPGSRVRIAQSHTAMLLGMICAAWDLKAVPVLMNHRWPQALQTRTSKLVTSDGPTLLDWSVSDPGVVVLPGSVRGLRENMPLEEVMAAIKLNTPSVSPPPFFSREDEFEALHVFTSGSTGEPRAAVHSFRNLNSAARAANQAIPLARGDRWLLSLPLYHVGGIGVVFRCAHAAAAIVIPEANEPLKDSLQHYAPTHVSLVATQLYRLVRDDKSAEALATCKAVVMGGGPTPEPLVREAVARGIKLVMSYGMTETAAMICCTRPGDPPERLLSSGRPLVEGTVSISAEGEILVRGDQLFLGYLQPDGSLLRPLTEDGWFRTGDLGHFDDAGYLHVTGRRDNMFISGGENIQPEEIERELRNVDGVEEAIVVPVDDAEWGRRPVAFVRLEEGRTLDPAALEERLRQTLPGYKIPRAIHPWPADLAQPGLKPARRDFEKRARDLATD
jgi:O-succinylbenzoic acid--CoA ligase